VTSSLKWIFKPLFSSSRSFVDPFLYHLPSKNSSLSSQATLQESKHYLLAANHAEFKKGKICTRKPTKQN